MDSEKSNSGQTSRKFKTFGKLPSTGNEISKLITVLNLILGAFSTSFLTSCQSKEQIKLDQFFVNGKNIYEAQCANCHQKDGKGLANLYPPISDSDFLKNKEKIICIIKNGANGEMIVNGKKYNQQMPANPQLYDLDIAALTTYIYNQWGDEKVITETDSVKKSLERCQ